MITTNLGIILIFIVIFGYISNWLNWQYLNYKVTRLLYYLGAFVHESSHAIACLATGAKIDEFNVISSQPHVSYRRSRLPLIGNLLISSAPIFGGLLFVFLVNKYLLGNYFVIGSFTKNWNEILLEPFRLIGQINLIHWQSWVMIAIFINIGAMIGPSFQDMRNVWLAIIILLFIRSSTVSEVGLLSLCFILTNIIIQIIAIFCIKVCEALSLV